MSEMTANSVDFYLSAENNLLSMSDHLDQSQQQHQQQQHQQQQQQTHTHQQQQSSTAWTNGTTTLSLVHQGLHHHQQQQQQQQQQHHQQQQQQQQQHQQQQHHHNPHHRDSNAALRSVNLNGVTTNNCGYHQGDHHQTANNSNTNNNGLGSLHLNGTNSNNPATPSSINQALSNSPSDTSSPLSNHDRESPTIINGTGHKRYLTEYLSENGSVNGNTNNSNNNNLNESEPLPKKLHTNGKKTKGRVKIKMEFIDNKLRRYTTFSKRKSGIMKKAYELSTLTGTQVMLLVASETGHVYTFATKKLKPMITSDTGKALIKTCLFSPEPQTNGYDPRMSSTGYEETELSYSVNDDSSEKSSVGFEN